MRSKFSHPFQQFSNSSLPNFFPSIFLSNICHLIKKKINFITSHRLKATPKVLQNNFIPHVPKKNNANRSCELCMYSKIKQKLKVKMRKLLV